MVGNVRALLLFSSNFVSKLYQKTMQPQSRFYKDYGGLACLQGPALLFEKLLIMMHTQVLGMSRSLYGDDLDSLLSILSAMGVTN